MLNKELINTTVPAVGLKDKVQYALQLMNENRVSHLPVTDGPEYAGLISEEDLHQSENRHWEIEQLEQFFFPLSVKEDDHCLSAFQLAAEYALSVVPVVNEKNEYIGALIYNDLFRFVSDLMNLKEPGGLIVLEIPSNQYSFQEISRLVESHDARITQLNTSNNAQDGMMQITLRINQSEVSGIVETFQRYDYHVKYYFGEEQYQNSLKRNYENLMNYLKI
ncbi:MAG: CBS domain-containing protein [Chitinophagaceae bacterium]|nr:CBS domain-containing protein [Chitinophagaceae bacterium]